MSCTNAGVARSRSIGLECMVRKLRKYFLLLGSAESESPQKLFVNIRGQIGLRVCRRHVCNRRAYSFVYRGCQKGVDVALMRPAHYDCHARDLSALVDLVSHDWVEVGTRGKQLVKVGHHAILPDERMGPVEVSVQRASHHLAAVIDAGGEGGSSSERKVDFCHWAVCAVQPNPGEGGRAVSTADLPGNLAAVVNHLGESAISEVTKRGDNVVFPRCAVNRCGAVSRVAYGLAQIVDPKREPVCIETHQRKRFGGAVFPHHRQRNLIIGCAGLARVVPGAVFRKSYDLSTDIDRARLPVISAERRESSHVPELPKKRATRMVCADAANVFAVRV